MTHLLTFLRSYRAGLISAAVHMVVLLFLIFLEFSSEEMTNTTIKMSWRDEVNDLQEIKIEKIEIEAEVQNQEKVVVALSESVPIEPQSLEYSETVPFTIPFMDVDLSTPISNNVSDALVNEESIPISNKTDGLSENGVNSESYGLGGNGMGGLGSSGSSFFYHKITNKKIIFVLDTSVSMKTLMGSTLLGDVKRIKAMNVSDKEKMDLTKKIYQEERERKENGDPTRFAYMIDEMKETITSLDKDVQFSVVFFHHKIFPLAGGLQFATEDNKRNAIQWMENINESGPTEPLMALQYAIRMAPEAIYFLTDGKFDQNIILKVNQFNRRRIPIHTVGLDDPSGRNVLLAMSNVSGGQFMFVSK